MVKAWASGDCLTITLEEEGIPFDPTEHLKALGDRESESFSVGG
jgi:hypothetical protein